MKTIRYYKKRKKSEYFLYLIPLGCFVFYFYLLTLELEVRTRCLIPFAAKSWVRSQSVDGAIYAFPTLGMFSLIAIYKVLNNNKGRKPELTLSDSGIYCLPTDLHPVEIPWSKIIEISKNQSISGKTTVCLELFEYIPDGYRQELKKVKIDIDRLSASNDEIIDNIYTLSKN